MLDTIRSAVKGLLNTERFRTPATSLNATRQPKRATAASPHAVVIGAGFGGLAAAIRLLVRGYRVTLVDRLEETGGRARVFRDKGFVFDAGPTLITAPQLFEELWDIAGKKMSDDVTMVPTTPFYRIRFNDGRVFNYTGDAKSMEAEIAKFDPTDIAGYRSFLEHSERIFKIGFSELAHAPFGKALDMLRIVPDMLMLENYKSVFSLVSKYIKNDYLRQVFSFHPLLVGGNPFSTSSIYALIAYLERQWGVWFAMGGTGAVVKGLTKLIVDLGGKIQLNTTVQKIEVRDRTVTGVTVSTDSGSEFIAADLVVSNADAGWTYRHLVDAEHRRFWPNLRVEKSRYSMSLFVWYFGTNRRYDDVAHHTILLGPRYEGLLNDIFHNKFLSDDFSLYLHRPTATDPNMAPDGCDAFYVLSPVPHLRSGTDWATETEPYRKKIEQYLSDTVLPGLKDKIVTSRVLNPQGFLDDYLALFGAAFSLEPVLTQSAYFRPHNKSEDVAGLYLVGAGTHPGAGMPGVLSSARVLDTVVPDPQLWAQTKAEWF